MSSSLLTYTSARTSPRGGPFTTSAAATRSGSSTMASASCCSVPTSRLRHRARGRRDRRAGGPSAERTRASRLSQERDPRLPCTGAGAPSPLRFGAAGNGVRERPTRAAPHRRSDGAPAPVLRRHGPRVPPRGRPAARPPLRPAPAAGACSRQRSEVPFVTPWNMKRRKPITCCTRRAPICSGGRDAGQRPQGATGRPSRWPATSPSATSFAEG